MIPQIHQERSLAKLKTSEIAEFMELICLITVASKSSITATASLEFLAGRSHDSMTFRKGTGDFKDNQGHGQNTFFSKMKGIQLPMKHGRRLLMQGQGLAQIHITWMFLDIRIVSLQLGMTKNSTSMGFQPTFIATSSGASLGKSTAGGSA